MTLPTPVRGQDHSAPVVDAFLTQSVTIPFAGASHVLVVDERICQVSIEAGVLTVLGLARGETVVLVWRNEDPETLVVRVESPPAAPIDARPTMEELDGMGHGSIGTVVHMATDSANQRSTTMVTPFAWTEGTPTHRFTMNGQVQDTRAADSSNIALDALSAQWVRGKSTITLLDFTTNLDGGASARITPFSRAGAFSLRGADVAIAGDGKNSVRGVRRLDSSLVCRVASARRVHRHARTKRPLVHGRHDGQRQRANPDQRDARRAPTQRLSDGWSDRSAQRSSGRPGPGWCGDQWRLWAGRFVVAERARLGLHQGHRILSELRPESTSAPLRSAH